MRARPRALRRAVTDEEKSRRREAILQAAKRVFARKGFQATTIADIARAARVSYGAVYWYFDSKEAVFHALMDAEEAALRQAIARALAPHPEDDPAGRLRAAVRATFEFFEADRAATKLLFRDAYALGDRFERHLFGIYERFIDDLAREIAAAQGRGLVRQGPARVMAFSVAALVGQLAHRRLSTDDGLDAALVADFAVTLIFEGLLPR